MLVGWQVREAMNPLSFVTAVMTLVTDDAATIAN